MKLFWEKHNHKIILISSLLFTGLFFVVYKNFFPELNLQKLLSDFSNFLGAWTYLLVAVFSFLETGVFIGIIAPSETVMIIGGAVAGQGAVNVYLLIGLGWISAFLGDSLSFFLGRKLGSGFLRQHGSKFGMNDQRINLVEEYFQKHGGKTVLIGRFIGIVRAFTPFIAGSSKMRYRTFVPYSVLGSGLQLTSIVFLGYFFSKNIEKAVDYVGKASLLIALAVAVVIVAHAFKKYFKEEENRTSFWSFLENHKILNYIPKVYRRLLPHGRFVKERFQYGETFGLEVTSLLAVLAVSGFIIVAYVSNIGSEPEILTRGDHIASDIAAWLQSGLLDRVAEIISYLGSRMLLSIVAMITTLILIINQKWIELVVLFLSLITIESGSDIINYLVNRPDSGSFPNSGAAFSALYAWLAIVWATRIKIKVVHVGGIILVAIFLPALIGLSNVYLETNYLSDSNAGWAFGAFIFAFYSTIALVLSQLGRISNSN